MGLGRWAIPSFTIDTWTDLLTVPAGQVVAAWSLLIANDSGEAATFSFRSTDTDGTTVLFQWGLTKAAGESLSAIQAPEVFKGGDKLQVKCDKVACAVKLSGEQK